MHFLQNFFDLKDFLYQVVLFGLVSDITRFSFRPYLSDTLYICVNSLFEKYYKSNHILTQKFRNNNPIILYVTFGQNIEHFAQ